MAMLMMTVVDHLFHCFVSFVLFGIRAVVVDAGGRLNASMTVLERWWSWIIPRIMHNISSTKLRHDWMSSDDRRVLWYAMAMIVGDVLRVSDIVLVTVSLARTEARFFIVCEIWIQMIVVVRGYR